jgi:hypothetical protein
MKQKESRIKICAGIFLFCLSYYMLIWSGNHYSIDGVVMFQYAKGILFQHSLFMSPPVVWGDFEFAVSKWAIGMSLAYVPILFFLSLTFFRGDTSFQEIPFMPDTPFNRELLINQPYQYSSWLNPVLTALTATVIFLIARKLKLTVKQSAAVALVFGIASPAAVYAKYDFAQPLASFLLILSLYFLLTAQKKGHIFILLSGFFLGLGILTRTEFLLFPAPVFMLAAYFSKPDLPGKTGFPSISRQFPKMLSMGAGIAAIVLVIFYLNHVRFGSILSFGYLPDSEFDFSIKHFFTALTGNLISPGRGILVFFPLALFIGLGFRTFFKQNRFAALLLAAIPVGMLGFYSFWVDWGGGHSWGPRFLVPALPYITILGVKGLLSIQRLKEKQKRGLLSAFIFIGFAVSLQGILFNILDFYRKLQLPGSAMADGTYHFHWRHSPLFTDWNSLMKPEQWDIFWLRHSSEGGIHWLYLAAPIICFLLGLVIMRKASRYFRAVRRSDGPSLPLVG